MLLIIPEADFGRFCASPFANISFFEEKHTAIVIGHKVYRTYCIMPAISTSHRQGVLVPEKARVEQIFPKEEKPGGPSRWGYQAF